MVLLSAVWGKFIYWVYELECLHKPLSSPKHISKKLFMSNVTSKIKSYSTSNRRPPCIPYVGLVLQDLTFVHIGNPDTFDNKVNFAKRWQQFNILVRSLLTSLPSGPQPIDYKNLGRHFWINLVYFNFLFYNSHYKFESQLEVLNQINQIESWNSIIDVVLGSNK